MTLTREQAFNDWLATLPNRSMYSASALDNMCKAWYSCWDLLYRDWMHIADYHLPPPDRDAIVAAALADYRSFRSMGMTEDGALDAVREGDIVLRPDPERVVYAEQLYETVLVGEHVRAPHAEKGYATVDYAEPRQFAIQPDQVREAVVSLCRAITLTFAHYDVGTRATIQAELERARAALRERE